MAKAAQSASGNVIAQTTMTLDTDVEFTVTPVDASALLFRESPVSPAPAGAKIPVVFYRKNNAWIGIGAHFRLYIDGENIATLHDGEYFKTELPASTRSIEVGQYSLGREWGNRGRGTLNLEAGRDNYYQVDFTMSGPPKVEERSVAEGTAAVARLKASAGSMERKGQTNTQEVAAPAAEARLVLYREHKVLGRGVDHGIKIDGSWVAVLKNGEYKEVRVPAGRIVVETFDVARGGFNPATIWREEIDLSPGRVNYLETQFNVNGAPKLRVPDESTASTAPSRLREAGEYETPRPFGA